VFASGEVVKMAKRLRQREKWKIKWELRKGRKRERGKTAKENEDRPDWHLPKDVLVDHARQSSWKRRTMVKKGLRVGASKLGKELMSLWS
jgi:chromosomal replication initiation ATPase DnaA